MTKNRIDPLVAHERAKKAARARWAREKDRTAATAAMRAARWPKSDDNDTTTEGSDEGSAA